MFPLRDGSAQISAVVFTEAEGEAWSEGPTADLIRTVVEMKHRNPSWGCPQIADQINLAFGTSINKDIVRRILALHYRPEPGADRSVMAEFPGACQGQFVVARLIPL